MTTKHYVRNIFDDKTAFPLIGEGNVLYEATDTGHLYRWNEIASCYKLWTEDEVNNISLKTDQDFYEFTESNNDVSYIFPNAYNFAYFGHFKKDTVNYHLVAMTRAPIDPWTDAGRPGNGFYLGSFIESDNDLLLVDAVNVETVLGIDILASLGLELGYEDISQLSPWVNGLSEDKINLTYYSPNYDQSLLNTYLSFNVEIDLNGNIIIDANEVKSRFTDAIDVDTYANIFPDQFISESVFQYGKEFTVNPGNPLEYYFISTFINTSMESIYSFSKYNFETNITTVITADLKQWWDTNPGTDIDFNEVNNVITIIPHPIETVILLYRSPGDTVFDGETYLLDFSENTIRIFNSGLSDYSSYTITKDKIYSITPWM
jgi:hypothetical protein